MKHEDVGESVEQAKKKHYYHQQETHLTLVSKRERERESKARSKLEKGNEM